MNNNKELINKINQIKNSLKKIFCLEKINIEKSFFEMFIVNNQNNVNYMDIIKEMKNLLNTSISKEETRIDLLKEKFPKIDINTKNQFIYILKITIYFINKSIKDCINLTEDKYIIFELKSLNKNLEYAIKDFETLDNNVSYTDFCLYKYIYYQFLIEKINWILNLEQIKPINMTLKELLDKVNNQLKINNNKPVEKISNKNNFLSGYKLITRENILRMIFEIIGQYDKKIKYNGNIIYIYNIPLKIIFETSKIENSQKNIIGIELLKDEHKFLLKKNINDLKSFNLNYQNQDKKVLNIIKFLKDNNIKSKDFKQIVEYYNSLDKDKKNLINNI